MKICGVGFFLLLLMSYTDLVKILVKKPQSENHGSAIA